ncbi:hypothetical protein ABBQ32_013341 [Trebouxia sp. C0010 RCD-2024]
MYGSGGWWGLLQMPFADNNPNSRNWPVIPIQFSKQYYAMMQYSKFIKNGWTILTTDADDWTLAAMRKHDDNDSSIDMAVVSTNTGLYNATTNWGFGALALPVDVEVYRTSATEDFARLESVQLSTSGVLQYDLPPNTITTFHMTFSAAPDSTPGQTPTMDRDEL